MKQTIAIIGLGNSGTKLTTRLVNSPYRQLLFDQDIAKAQTLASQLLQANPLANLDAIDCQVNASWEADIIVLATPESSINEVADRIQEVAICKIVIVLTQSQHDGDGSRFESAAIHVGEELQQRLPNSKVVNLIITGEGRTDAFLISTHQEALTTVSVLVHHAGMNPIIAEDWSENN